jgi:hypothetical protein
MPRTRRLRALTTTSARATLEPPLGIREEARMTFSSNIRGSFLGKSVEVSIIGGKYSLLTGTLSAVEDDFLILAQSQKPEGQHLIPFTAIAFLKPGKD